jgi:uncharacterized RDD family membrane protein YckC
VNPSPAPRDSYAGLVSRSGALLVDVLVLIVATLAVGDLPVLAWEQIISPHAPRWFSTAAYVAAAVLPWVYFTSFWWLTGQTVGDLVTGVVVQHVDGGGLSFPHAAIRALGCLVLAPLWVVGLLWVVWDRRRMAWHDHVFRTAVRYVGTGPRSGAGRLAA